MDVAIAFLIGIFIGSAAGTFTFALLAAAKMEDDMTEQWDRGYSDGKDDKRRND